jgi:cytochrome c oxidase subunit I
MNDRVEPKTHGSLAFGWLWLSGLAAVTGFVLAFFMRVELANPGLGWMEPAFYNAVLLGHGSLLLLFVLLPLAIPALGHLTLFAGDDAVAPPLLSRLALWGFALGLGLWCAAFLIGLAVADANTGWALYIPGAEAKWPVALTLLKSGEGVAMLALALGAVGLIWSILMRSLALSPAGFALLPACVFAVVLSLARAWDMVLHFRGVPPTEGVPLDRAIALLLLLAGVGLLHAAVQRVTQRALVAAPLASVLTLALVVCGVLTLPVAAPLASLLPAGVQLGSVIVTLLLAQSLVWLITLLMARPFAWPVALCVLGLLAFYGLTFANAHEEAADQFMQETHFVVAYGHLHSYVSFVFVVFAALYACFPALTRDWLSSTLVAFHLGCFSVGAAITFVPLFFLGLQGMPRRYADYPDAFATWNQVASMGSVVMGLGLLAFAALLIRTRMTVTSP